MEKILLTLHSVKGNARRISALILFIALGINVSGQKLQTILTETWLNGNWKNSAMGTYSYDVNQYLINTLLQSWDDISGWLNGSQMLITNYPNGTVDNSVNQIWNNQVWNDASRITFNYNLANKVLTSVTEIWTGSVWLNSIKETNTYDGSGYLTNKLSQHWDFVSPWVNSSQSNYSNNPNGTVHITVIQKWNSVSSAWDDFQRFTYTYNASSNILTELDEIWSSGNWINNFLTTNTYNGSGYLSNELLQIWNSTSTRWVNDTQTDNTYNANGTISQSVIQAWDLGLTSWVNSDRITYSYTPSTGHTEVSDEESLIVYPNPAHDLITIESDNDGITAKSYSLVDLTGKQVQSGRLTDRITTLDISRLANGIYILRSGDKKLLLYKVVKH